MARIVAFTDHQPREVGVEADLYTDCDDPCIMVRTFDAASGVPVPLDDMEAENLANSITVLVARLRELNKRRAGGDHDQS